MIEHKIAYELIEEFVFGTLSQTEHDQLQEHLDSGCEQCAARYREVSELSVQLAQAVSQQTPAPAVKENLLKQIHGDSKFDSNEVSSKTIWPWVSAVSIAASLLLLFWANSLRNELASVLDELQQSQVQIARLIQDSSVQKDAAYLLGLPCSWLVDLKGVAPNKDAFAKIVLNPKIDFAVAYVYRMPPPPDDKEYQLWIELDGEPVSIGVFKVGEDGQALLKLQSISDPMSIQSFQVTIEPKGGLAKPSGMQYLMGMNAMPPMPAMQ